MRGRGAAQAARRVLLLLTILAAAAPAAGQDRPKKRPTPPAAASAAPPEPASAPTPLIKGPPPQLRSAVRSQSSRTPVIGRSTTAQCRARCAEQRLDCMANPDDTAACGSNWTQCLSDCAGLGYGRAQP